MPARATPATGRVAAAFAPGHVTAVFSPDLTARDPRGRGSVGAGLVLELGVRAVATWRAGGAGSFVRIVSDVPGPLPISTEVARRLVGARPGRVTVMLSHDLPIGQGFGMSASGALAVGLAVASTLGRPMDRAVATAHLADLFGGGGLGGVSAILGGGLEIRVRPGVPPFGRVLHKAFRPRLLLAVVGRPLPSPKLLRDATFLDRVREQAVEALPRLREHPDARTLFVEAERFSDGLGLASPAVQRRLADLRATGASAAQSMFGNSVVILPQSVAQRKAAIRVLQRARLPAVELRTAARGAHLVPRSP